MFALWLSMPNVQGPTCSHCSLVCLVVDECHRTVGDAPVSKLLKMLREKKANFRVLGLSATPGNSTDSVQVCAQLPKHCLLLQITLRQGYLYVSALCPACCLGIL